jgi:hypothetical protein
MVPRERFINKLSELGFLPVTPRGQRVMLMKRPSDKAYASIPLRELLEKAFVYESLCLHGVDEEQAEQFVEGNDR